MNYPNRTTELSTSQTLSLIGVAGVVTILLTFVPVVSWLNYPFRLLLTMVHELSHGLTAMVTGGEFLRFVIYPDGSGLAYTAGGWRILVIPAGYLGTALFGAGLILLGRSQKWGRFAIGGIGLFMMLFSLLYGAPSILSEDLFYGILTTFSGLVFGAIFLLVALKAGEKGIIFWIHFLAIQAGLTAFSDIITLIGISTSSNMPSNDAQSMADLLFGSAMLWAVSWAFIAVIIIGGAIGLAWVRPALQKPKSPNLPYVFNLKR